MYKEFYLMQKEPFDSHPSPELFYKSNVHQTAWHYLVQGIKQHEPILVLAGEYGAGKTLLFLKMVRLLEKKGRLPIVAVPSPTYNFAMILEKIVEKLLNISAGSIDAVEESKLQQAVYEYFENNENRYPIYIVIDDAQEFSYSFINKLRLFASYNCDGFFPIRLIFFAHHSFLKLLEYKKLKALGQRIRRIYHLKPLNYEETKEYIYYRLIHSGATGTPIFSDEAVSVILSVSGGNPRLINNVCDICLLVAGERRINVIDEALVYSAMETGDLPGIEKIERSGTVQPEFPQPESWTQPPAPQFQEPGGMPQVSQPQMPSLGEHHPPGAYFRPESQSYPQQVGPPPIHEEASLPEYSPELKASDRSFENGQGFWSNYGKIGAIIFLVIVLFFLLSYLFRSVNSNFVGATSTTHPRIVKKVPASQYGIHREIPLQEADPVGTRDMEKIKPHPLFKQPEFRTGKRYEPVLLTDNLGN